MSDFTYKPALKYSQNEIAAMDLWALIVKTGSTASADDEAITLADINNLNEYDGNGYERIQLTGVAVEDDAGADRWAKLVSDPLEWPQLEPLAGDDEALGIIIYAEQGTPWDEYDEYPVDGEDTRLPIMWKDSGGFPQNPANDVFRWTPSGEGLTYKVSRLASEIVI